MSNPSRAVVRATRRLAFAIVPEDRRIKGMGGARGRGRLQLRKLVAPVFQRPVTLTTQDGLRLRVGVDPVDEHIAQHVLGPNRREYFPAWPDDPPVAPCILDVGAHHGYYAAAALHEYPGARVICVEPSAAAVEGLRMNLALNNALDRTRIVTAALAPGSGEGRLMHTDEGSWGASLYEEPSGATSSETVQLLTLHSILAGARPDIVKCNAEGAEYSLLDQLAACDLRPAFMVVMVHPEFGDLPRLLGQAETMGYRVNQIGTADRPAFQMWRDAPHPAPSRRSD